MCTKLAARRDIFSLTKSFLFITVLTMFSLFANAQDRHLLEGETAICKITVNDKVYQPTLNQIGYFDRVLNIAPLATVHVEMKYPVGKTGEKVVVAAVDGGNLDGKAIKVVPLNNEGKCLFDFQVNKSQGLYRINLKKGKDEKFIQLWVNEGTNVSVDEGDGHSGFGSNHINGPDDPVYTGLSFLPYSGNEFRFVLDLQIWGAVGEIPMQWMRYGNSRHGDFKSYFGKGHSWNHSFDYQMFDYGIDTLGRAQVKIHYPEGGANVFTQDAGDPNLWLAGPGVDKRLFKNGNNFFLQMANGWRYRFEKLDINGSVSYLLRTITDQYQNVDTLTYDSNRRLSRVTEPAGRFFEIFYGEAADGSKVIDSVRTSDGRSVQYHYSIDRDTVGSDIIDWVILDTVKYGDGTKAVYAYSQNAPGIAPVLEHAIDPRCIGTDVDMKYIYDTTDNVIGFIKEEHNGKTGELMTTLTSAVPDRIVCYSNGRTEIYKEPSQQLGYINTYTDGLGRKTKYTYDQGDVGFIKTKKDNLGRITTYNAITIYGNPLEITYPDGSSEKWTRDNLDLVLTHTDELERVTTYHRDANHHIEKIDYPDGASESFTYNSFSEMVTHTHRNGGKDSSAYDSRGLKTSFTDALRDVTLYTYDAADEPASVTDARGNTTAFEYNERGLLTKIINPDNSFKISAYDEFGNLTSNTDELNHTWKTEYDGFRRLVSKTDPLNRSTKYEYNLPGGICGCAHDRNNPTSIISPSGKITKIQYDVEWEIISETVGFGTADAATTMYEYDKVGNLSSMIDPRLNEWIMNYDLRDRKKSSTDPLGNKTNWDYDKTGNLVKQIRPDGGITTNKYDKMNRPVEITDPKGQVTKMKYDEEGNMVKFTDPNNHDYKFRYDLLNRKLRMTYPDGSFETYTYDHISNLKTYTNRTGSIRTYTYDNRNREIKSEWNDGITPAITSKYDAANRVVKLANNVSTLYYKYDDANELTSEEQKIEETGKKRIVSYTYTKDGLRETLQYPGGDVVGYRYTGRDQIDSIAVNEASPLAIYTYDLNGNRVTKALENGTHTNYSYDDANHILSVDNQKSGVSFTRFDYGYDNVDRRTYVKRDNGLGDVFHYDAIDQVAEVRYDATDPDIGNGTNPARVVNYGLDNAGNRTYVKDNTDSLSYEVNNLNEYIKVGNDSIYNDANGNLKSFNGFTYTYDAQSRLINATNGTTTVQFAYDAHNRCVKRTTNGSPTFFYYDDWNLIEERNTGNTLMATYLNGALVDEILKKNAVATPGVYYHYDALSSVIALTNKNGNLIEKYSYDVFGKPTIKDKNGNIIAASAYKNRFMFNGREYIQELNLYDYRNRMYSDSLGRFLQTDPLKFRAGDYNLYRYVGNNSINLNDPLGLYWVPVTITITFEITITTKYFTITIYIEYSETYWIWINDPPQKPKQQPLPRMSEKERLNKIEEGRRSGKYYGYTDPQIWKDGLGAPEDDPLRQSMERAEKIVGPEVEFISEFIKEFIFHVH